MFGIGAPELVVILIIGLIFIGPEKLPQVAKTVGGGLRDLRRAANLAQAELRETVDDLIREADLRDFEAREAAKHAARDAERAKQTADNETSDPGDSAKLADKPENTGDSLNLRGDEEVVATPLDGPPATDAAPVTPDESDMMADADDGFTFDDDPDDWDPDDFNDSAEPADHPSHHKSDNGPVAIASEDPAPPAAPTAVAAPPPGPEGTHARTLPPTMPPPTTPPPAAPPHAAPPNDTLPIAPIAVASPPEGTAT